jgi:hypothetical protein
LAANIDDFEAGDSSGSAREDEATIESAVEDQNGDVSQLLKEPEDPDMAEPSGAPAAKGGGGGGQQPVVPRKPLTDLSKEELVVKCKGLLQIAQKAKVAKDGREG